MTGEDLWSGPVAVMLAKAQDAIPGPAALPGGTIWELKYDGYRSVLRSGEEGTSLWSRQGTDLSGIFPELIGAATEQLPDGLLLDGEVVIWRDGRLDFDQLQQRMGASAAAVARSASEHPASYIAFDLLAVGGIDVRSSPWRDRRTLLEELAQGFAPPLELSPYTDDHATAEQWFHDYPAAGVEGLVAKGAGSPYRSGVRGWIKIKARHSVDAVVGAVIGSVERPEALVAGRRTADGELIVLGRSGPLNSAQARELALLLRVAVNDHPWPAHLGSGHFGGPVAITQVEPTVVIEVAADTALQGGRHRHPLRLLRIRPELTPDDLAPIGEDLAPPGR
ncbi:MAG TPA: ATP-dependent DNA ligase [Microlunatus sp.]|nr:ATP-dependent DNA ligase [Microlunatus sp.]